MSKCFTVSSNASFSVKFANNIVVSISWGEISLSNKQTTAECAAWDEATDEIVRVPGFDYFVPYSSPEDVARFMSSASTMVNPYKEANQ